MVVELKSIRDKADAAVEFLKLKTGADWKLKGTRVEAETRTHEVKLLLHKFLRHQGLNNHRVLVRSRVLEIQQVEPKPPRPEADKIRGVPPFPPVSGPGLPGLATVYPNYPPLIRTKPPTRRR